MFFKDFSNEFRGVKSCLSVMDETAQLGPIEHASSWFAAVFIQQQVVEFNDNVGKVSELHKVRGNDVDPACPRLLILHPGDDGR